MASKAEQSYRTDWQTGAACQRHIGHVSPATTSQDLGKTAPYDCGAKKIYILHIRVVADSDRSFFQDAARQIIWFRATSNDFPLRRGRTAANAPTSWPF